jgi:hypothetical protein
MVSDLPVAFRRTGIGFLSHPVPAGELGLPHGRLTGPSIGSDSDGVSTFRMREMRPGRVPSMPRGRRCSRGRSGASGRRLPLPSGQPCTPVEHPVFRGSL